MAIKVNADGLAAYYADLLGRRKCIADYRREVDEWAEDAGHNDLDEKTRNWIAEFLADQNHFGLEKDEERDLEFLENFVTVLPDEPKEEPAEELEEEPENPTDIVASFAADALKEDADDGVAENQD